MNKLFNRGNAAGIITVVVVLLLWQVIATIKQTVYVPPVSTIFLTFIKEWFSPTFGQQAVPSLYRMIVGYCCASIFGVTLGVLIGFTELTAVIKTSANNTGNAVETILVLVVVFLAISLPVSAAINAYNRALARRGYATR